MSVDGAGEVQWATEHRRTQKLRNLHHRRIVDSAGNLFEATRSEGLATVTKHNAEGREEWKRFWDGSGDSGANAIVADSIGNIFILGQFSENLYVGSTELTSNGACATFVNKLNTDGDILWSVQLAGIGKVNGYGIVADDENNVVVTGAFEGTLAVGTEMLRSAGGQDVFVAKLSSDGSVMWGMAAGGPGQDYGSSVAADKYGDMYVTGAFSGTASFGSTTLQSQGELDIFWMKLRRR